MHTWISARYGDLSHQDLAFSCRVLSISVANVRLMLQILTVKCHFEMSPWVFMVRKSVVVTIQLPGFENNVLSSGIKIKCPFSVMAGHVFV